MTVGLWAVVLFASATPPTVIPPRDFVEYWSAARVLADGGNPYDGKQLLPYQQLASGHPDKSEAVMLWTPPWTLPLYHPFGWLEPGPAHTLWLLVQLACGLASAGLLWQVYGPRGSTPHGRSLWLAFAVAVALSFGPGWWLIVYGQNTAFILLGVAGFVYLRQRGYPVAAGAVVALTAIKPHLLALFGLALILDARTAAGRRTLAGGIGAILAASAVALLADPAIFGKFGAALSRPTSPEAVSVADWQLPLLSYRLREWLAPHQFAVQFLSLAGGVLLLLLYWWLRRANWHWPTETPRLVFASALLAPYGGWIFDLVVLLVPVLAAFGWVLRHPRMIPVSVAVAGHLVMSFATLLAPIISERHFAHSHMLHDYIWITPAIVLWAILVTWLAKPTVTTAAGKRS